MSFMQLADANTRLLAQSNREWYYGLQQCCSVRASQWIWTWPPTRHVQNRARSAQGREGALVRALWARSNTIIPYITLVITSLAVERAAARHQPFHREDGLCFILSFSSRLGAKTEGGGPGEAKPRAPGKLKALSATGVGRRCSREAEALKVCGRVCELWLLPQLRQGGTRSPAPTVPLQRDARGILLSSRARRAAIND